MKVVVIGASGRTGARLVPLLSEKGHDVVSAAPSLGINTVTGEGVMEAVRGAGVVIDVSNSPSYVPAEALGFFETSMRNLRAAEWASGVQHHITLSIVGIDQLAEGGYFRAKLAQERMVETSLVPYTILRATQFFEFIRSIADASTHGDVCLVPDAHFQPIALDDVVRAITGLAEYTARNEIVEIGGPEVFRIADLVRQVLLTQGDPRDVLADGQTRYFGARLGDRTLVPRESALVGATRFDEWLRPSIGATPVLRGSRAAS